METFPILYTKRLKLRKIQPEDIPSLIQYANNKKVSDRILNIPYPYPEPTAILRISYVVRGFKNKSRYIFSICLKEKDVLIGEISLHLDNPHSAQLGYWIGAPFWNKGITTEAVKAVIRFGFEEIKLKMIYASCHLDNHASSKILLKNDMTKIKRLGNIDYYSISSTAYKTVNKLKGFERSESNKAQ